MQLDEMSLRLLQQRSWVVCSQTLGEVVGLLVGKTQLVGELTLHASVRNVEVVVLRFIAKLVGHRGLAHRVFDVDADQRNAIDDEDRPIFKRHRVGLRWQAPRVDTTRMGGRRCE